MTLVQQTVRYGGKSEKERLAEAEAILSDKINGMPVSQIMEKYSCSKQTVYNRIDAAVDARIAPTVDRHREQMNAAYDEQVERCNQNINGALALIEILTSGPEAKPGDLATAIATHARGIELLNRTREAQRKLNGLDLPAKVDVTVTVQDETERAVAALNEQLAHVSTG